MKLVESILKLMTRMQQHQMENDQLTARNVPCFHKQLQCTVIAAYSSTAHYGDIIACAIVGSSKHVAAGIGLVFSIRIKKCGKTTVEIIQHS